MYSECPFCGDKHGYYITETVKRDLLFKWNGEPDGSTEDMTVYYGTRKRCINCDKVIPINKKRE